MTQGASLSKLLALSAIALCAMTGVGSAAQVTLVTPGDLPIAFSAPGNTDILVQNLVGVITSNITSARGSSVALLDTNAPVLADLLGFLNLVNQSSIIVAPEPQPARGGGGGGGGGFAGLAVHVASSPAGAFVIPAGPT